jgi:hypothetical protein
MSLACCPRPSNAVALKRGEDVTVPRQAKAATAATRRENVYESMPERVEGFQLDYHRRNEIYTFALCISKTKHRVVIRKAAVTVDAHMERSEYVHKRDRCAMRAKTRK